MGVLDRDRANVGLVVVFGVNRFEHVGEREGAGAVIDRGELDSGVASGRPHLEANQVLRTSYDDEVAGHGNDAQRNLIRHHT